MNARLIVALPVFLLSVTPSSAEIFGRVSPSGIPLQPNTSYSVIHDSTGHYELVFPGMSKSKRICLIVPVGNVFISKIAAAKTGCSFLFRNTKTGLPQNAGFSFVENLG